MTPAEFVEKWSATELSERAASQEHFIDLCRLLGQPTPAEADPTGTDYAFEKPVKVTLSASKGSKGEGGFVDVWKRGRFAWEYKRKDKYKNLDEAYRQLYQYRDALDNPPLSVVCDIRTTEIRTHFPGYPTHREVVKLEEIPGRLEVLRRVFTNPDSFRPSKTTTEVTKELADEFAGLADRLIDRYPPGDLTLWNSPGSPVAHFLMKVMFCLFAEDVDLLPDKAFTKLIERALFAPESFQERAAKLFALMRTGGEFGNDLIPYFNGGLFDDAPPLPLLHGDIIQLHKAATRDWSGVEPSIFGTLFERILDPEKRAQIGAHYTSKEDILLVVEPVVMTPLRRTWQSVQEEIREALGKHDAEPDRKKRDFLASPVRVKFDQFRRHLATQRILDPACGSGNFLYVALQQLLDLDDAVVRFAALHDITLNPQPYVRPVHTDGKPQIMGIEINRYAAELAQVVIWIGYLQWMHDRSIDPPQNPILDKLQSIENRDAILNLTDKECPAPAKWPEADFIIGNPPFLGSKMFRQNGLSDEYVQALFSAYDLPKTSDLCCYWFELGSREIEAHKTTRAGLLATQGIRGRDNRAVLDRIKDRGDIFLAWSDRNWILDGAAVHVSIIGFDDGRECGRSLNGAAVDAIFANLTSNVDVTDAKRLTENLVVRWSIGTQKGGAFDIPWVEARDLLSEPNPQGRSNRDVVKPWFNASDITGRMRGMWIIDFGPQMSEGDAALYERPFGYAKEHVKPDRDANRRDSYRLKWWIHQEARGELRPVLESPFVLLTPRVSKHRIWLRTIPVMLPDCTVVIFSRSDDFFFGVLHSSLHDLWSRQTGTQLREAESGFRYTPTTCFETFPLPWPPGKERAIDPAYARLSAAAKELNDRRDRWLNPPEWVGPIAQRIDEADDYSDVPADARPLIRQSAILAAAAKDPRLKKRTLTNLYNERPDWLKLAHEALDRAVLAAYAATDSEGKWDEDWSAVWTETGAGQPLPKGHALIEERRRVDHAVLANLLRLNGERGG